MESDLTDAFHSLRQGMSDAVAALKTTDFLLAQLDNLSRSPEVSTGNPHTLTDRPASGTLISPIVFPYTFCHIQPGFQIFPKDPKDVSVHLGSSLRFAHFLKIALVQHVFTRSSFREEGEMGA